jgi:hypothetical protein
MVFTLKEPVIFNMVTLTNESNIKVDLSIAVYSHSEYYDLWEPFFSRLKKYHCECKIYFFVDKVINDFQKKYEFIEINYNNDDKYSSRLFSCLNQINDDHILYLHEDMLLYDYVDISKLKFLHNFIRENNHDFIRLIKSGVNSNHPVNNNLYRLDEMDFLFSITPTIWDREYLKGVLNDHKDLSIWELEESADSTLREKQEHGLYWYNSEPSRGRHFDSSVFPHMSSAIFKGKWNMEYRSELSQIFDEFNIDKNVRGTIF